MTLGVTTGPDEKVYVLAPLGTIVNDLPEQMLPLLTEMVGEALTVTVLVAESALTQPAVLVPVTV